MKSWNWNSQWCRESIQFRKGSSHCSTFLCQWLVRKIYNLPSLFAVTTREAIVVTWSISDWDWLYPAVLQYHVERPSFYNLHAGSVVRLRINFWRDGWGSPALRISKIDQMDLSGEDFRIWTGRMYLPIVLALSTFEHSGWLAP